MTNNTNKTNRPVYRKQLPGGVSIAIFEKTREGRTYRSANLQRSYYNGKEWVRSNVYFDHEQLPFAIELLQAALKYLSDTPLHSQASEPEAEPNEEEAVPADA